MIVEVGKSYRSRDGRKIGPMSSFARTEYLIEMSGDGYMWHPNGANKYCAGGPPRADDDLVSEWPAEMASPIREITRKEIVPGRYGVLSIGGKYDMPDCDDPSKASTIGIHVTLMSNTLSADELDAAASVLTQIAAVLRENQ